MTKKKDENKTMAIVLAVLSLGWLGAKMRGDNNWMAIFVMWLIGWILTITIIGVIIGGPLLFIAYIWGLLACVKD